MTKSLNSFNVSKLLTPSEVAEYLSISKATVYRLIQRRQIRFYKIGGKLRFAQDDLKQYLENSCIEPIR